MTLQQTISDEHIKLFSQKILKKGHHSCWEWQGAKIKGYGSVRINNVALYAHRVSWELFFGSIPEGKFVLHKCNNPACVNPYHLYLGDQYDNVHDSIEANTFGPLKLSSSDLEEVRALIDKNVPCAEIAHKFKVAYQTIWKISKGHTHAKRRT